MKHHVSCNHAKTSSIPGTMMYDFASIVNSLKLALTFASGKYLRGSRISSGSWTLQSISLIFYFVPLDCRQVRPLQTLLLEALHVYFQFDDELRSTNTNLDFDPQVPT